MAEYKLKLKNRELTGKKVIALRKEGMIPSVVYGGKTPILTASAYVETEKVLEKAGYHSPIDLDIEGKKRIAIVKDVAFDSVSRRIINIEFLPYLLDYFIYKICADFNVFIILLK